MSEPSININGRRISVKEPPYVIAEMSANHNGSLDQAFKLLEVAAKAGADAVKLQTYTPDTLTLNCNNPEFILDGGLWDGMSLYELYSKASLPWDWHQDLFDKAKDLNLTIFSTPFDKSAVDFLENLNTPAYKVASFEVIDLPLIKYIASTKKPMIISTGMADKMEIQEAIDTARDGGCKDIAILHCVSGYPAPAADYNLRVISDMHSRYGVTVGLSDHTIDNTTAITSIALGASIIEKHYTLDRNGGGPDDSFSLEPKDLEDLCRGANIAWSSLGASDYGYKSSEIGSVQYRRSLYFVKDLDAGSIVTEESVRSVRPGIGLPPKTINKIIGKRLKRAVKENSPTTLDVFED
ncbi:MAG: pseudaminic acid synthase [Candidatus Azotimanducaceae bacterium]